MARQSIQRLKLKSVFYYVLSANGKDYEMTPNFRKYIANTIADFIHDVDDICIEMSDSYSWECMYCDASELAVIIEKFKGERTKAYIFEDIDSLIYEPEKKFVILVAPHNTIMLDRHANNVRVRWADRSWLLNPFNEFKPQHSIKDGMEIHLR